MRRIPPIPPDLADGPQAQSYVRDILAYQSGQVIDDLAPGADLPTTVAKVNEILAVLRDAATIRE